MWKNQNELDYKDDDIIVQTESGGVTMMRGPGNADRRNRKRSNNLSMGGRIVKPATKQPRDGSSQCNSYVSPKIDPKHKDKDKLLKNSV